jgi:hypothetical protein
VGTIMVQRILCPRGRSGMVNAGHAVSLVRERGRGSQGTGHCAQVQERNAVASWGDDSLPLNHSR